MVETGGRGETVRLLMEHRSSLFAFILAIVRDYDTAEEVLQEVSVAVCEAGEDFRLGTDFGAWSREIARRRILAHYRLAGRFPDSLSDDDIRNLETGFNKVDAQSTAKERMDSLRQCLKAQTPRARRLLHLRYAARFSLGEIAVQVDRQPESVRKALYRTRQALRKCIEHRLRVAEQDT